MQSVGLTTASDEVQRLEVFDYGVCIFGLIGALLMLGVLRQCADANLISLGLILYGYMYVVCHKFARQSLHWISACGSTPSLLSLYMFQSCP